MESLQVPRPSWMTEDLVLLEEQARRFLESEFVPHVEKWTEDGIMERSGWNKLGQAGLLCASMPEEYGGAGGLVWPFEAGRVGGGGRQFREGEGNNPGARGGGFRLFGPPAALGNRR